MSDFISKSRLKWEVEKWYEKEYYSSFNAAVYKALLKIIDKFPSVEQENYGDCISRQAAKSKAVYSHERHEKVVPVADLDWLLSVEPERKPGKWIMSHDKNAKLYGKCSNCGMCNYAGYTNYCPDCGAKMEVDNG